MDAPFQSHSDTNREAMTFGSLFAGIGGMDLGLERAGMTCKWQVEIDPFCNKILEKHWPHVKRYGDIRTVTDLEQVDLIAGGFPCQDISISGLGAGIAGPKSGLWSEYLRLIRLFRPGVVLLENVAALLIRGFSRVLADLAQCGYDAEWNVLRAAEFGAPHDRARLFLVAYAHGQRRKGFVFQGENVCLSTRSTPTQFGNRIISCGGWWANGGNLRMGDGLRARLDRSRIRALGNAVVPQVAEWIGRRIMAAVAKV